jgi:hypothetical protein
MLAKRVMIGLFAISMVVMLGRDATAGCASLGGVWQCGDWIKTSTTGEGQSHAGEPIKCTPPDCPSVTFELRGLVDQRNGQCPFPGADGCGLEGILVCLSKNCSNPDLQQCINQGETKGHMARALMAIDVTDDCTKRTCNTFKTSATFGSDVGREECPPGLPVSEFTAVHGIFIQRLCPFGNQPDGACCDSLERTPEGNCIGEEPSVALCEECSLGVAMGDPLPPDGTLYICEPIDQGHPSFVPLGCSPPGKNN